MKLKGLYSWMCVKENIKKFPGIKTNRHDNYLKQLTPNFITIPCLQPNKANVNMSYISCLFQQHSLYLNPHTNFVLDKG